MEKIKEYLPVASAFLLIVGAMRLIFYYKFFDVDIASYIDLSEIFSLSLSFFINSSIVLLLFLIFLTPAVSTAKEEEVMLGWSDPSKEISYTKREFYLARLLFLSYMVFWFSTSYDIFDEYTMDFRVSVDSIIVLLTFLFIFFFISYLSPILRSSLSKNFNIHLSSSVNMPIVTIIGVTTLCIAYSRNDARSILLRSKAEFAEVKIGEGLVKSSDKYRYIGKTKNFVFFYNTVTKVADAYPLDEANKISVPD